MKKWVTFAILASIYFLVYFHRTSPAVLADILAAEFSASALALGLLSSAYFYPYAILQIPVGAASDYIGAKKVIFSFTLTAAVGCLLFALASSFEMATLARFLIGVGVAGVYVPTLKVISKIFEPREFATTIGILFAVGNFGAIFSTLPLAYAVNTIGWRETFLILAALTLSLVALSTMVADVRSGERIKLSDLPKVVRERNLWLLGVSGMLRYGVMMGYQGLWGGAFLMTVYGMDRELAGSILLSAALGTLVSSPLMGLLSDRVFGRKETLMFGAIGFLICWFPLTFATTSLSVAQLFAISFALGFFSGAGPVAYALVVESFPLRMTGLATSVLNVFPFIGASLFQVLMGYMLDVGMGYSEVFATCLAASLVSLLCLLMIREDR
ncbi:MAG: MFS transporter [Archaeoglobaceae archaeon]